MTLILVITNPRLVESNHAPQPKREIWLSRDSFHSCKFSWADIILVCLVEFDSFMILLLAMFIYLLSICCFPYDQAVPNYYSVMKRFHWLQRVSYAALLPCFHLCPVKQASSSLKTSKNMSCSLISTTSLKKEKRKKKLPQKIGVFILHSLV